MANITATKVVRIHARVTADGLEFQVYPNSTVFMWAPDACEWFPYDASSRHYDEVLAAGLAALQE